MESMQVLEFTNPATGEKFGQVAAYSPEAVNQAVRQMRLVSKIWAAKPLAERVRILRRFQGVMLDAIEEITAAINQETGKSRQDALVEVFLTAELLHVYLEHARRWLRRQRVPNGVFFFKQSYIEQRPFGVVAVISPWNYPFALAMQPVLSALLAGNVVLLKPSEVTPAVGVMMETLFQRVPELTPYIQVLHGGGETGAALVEAAPDFIYLTGSTATGHKVLETAAQNLTPVALELGGKDAMVVLEDADLESAARWGVWGAFFNTGQTCMSVERVYVVEQVYDEFVRLALEETRRLKIGYTGELESPYYMGPISDPRQVRIIERHLQDAIDKGARILQGGERRENFISPTLLVNVNHDMLLMREETFGPLMPVMKVKDEAEAIRMANDSIFGLGASVWTQDILRGEQVASQIEAGSIIINDTIAQFAVPMLPFGGIKNSGIGRSHGKEGLLTFTQPHAYLVGKPPYRWDFVVIARRPGNYRLVAGLTRLFFGVELSQKLSPLKHAWASLFHSQNTQPAHTHQEPGAGQPKTSIHGAPTRARMAGLLVSVLGAAAGLAFVLRHIRR